MKMWVSIITSSTAWCAPQTLRSDCCCQLLELSCNEHGPNQSMKPTSKVFASGLAPFRSNLSVLATTPWISSGCPATLVRFSSPRSHTPAVLSFNASRGLSFSRWAPA
jgi:hypothetical protein